MGSSLRLGFQHRAAFSCSLIQRGEKECDVGAWNGVQNVSDQIGTRCRSLQVSQRKGQCQRVYSRGEKASSNEIAGCLSQANAGKR